MNKKKSRIGELSTVQCWPATVKLLAELHQACHLSRVDILHAAIVEWESRHCKPHTIAAQTLAELRK